MVSDAARLSHARKRPQRPVIRAPPSNGKRSSSRLPAVVQHQRRGPARAGRPEQRPSPGAVRAPNSAPGRPHRAAPATARPRRHALLHRPLRRSVRRSAARAIRSPRKLRPSAPAPRSRAPDHPASSRLAHRDAARAPSILRRHGRRVRASGGTSSVRARRTAAASGHARRRRSSGRSPGAGCVSAFGDRGQHRRDRSRCQGHCSKVGRGAPPPAMRRRLIPVQLLWQRYRWGSPGYRQFLTGAETRRPARFAAPLCSRSTSLRGWEWCRGAGVGGSRWRRGASRPRWRTRSRRAGSTTRAARTVRSGPAANVRDRHQRRRMAEHGSRVRQSRRRW